MDDDPLDGPLLAGVSTPKNYGSDSTRLLDSESTHSSEAQEGVRSIEAVAMTWTKRGLTVAYLGIFLMSFTTSLEGQVTYSLTAFATSSFNKHSLISTVYVVQGVVNAVIKPPMAKVADVFGRLEAFSLSVLLCVLGYIQMAASQNIQTYASAQIFYSAGATGLQILQQIFIADTSSLLNRALLASLTDTPFLVTVWIGSLIASAILKTTTWRWGYGMWAIILPAAFAPLALSLLLNSRKARRLGLVAERKRREATLSESAHQLFRDLDGIGILLLSAAFALILLPLTLASTIEAGWGNTAIPATLFMGILCLLAFPVWEAQSRWVPHPLIPLTLLKSRTFCAGCGVGFFFFMVFYLSVQPYFYSYLLVVQNQSVAAAGRITQTFSFAATITILLTSLAIKQIRHYKLFVVMGSVVYVFGILLMIYFRQEGAYVSTIVLGQAVLGMGAGMLHGTAQLGVQAAAGKHQNVATATAVFMTMVEIGGAVGAAISGALWGTIIPAKLEEYLPESEKQYARDIYANIVEASTRYPLGSVARAAVNRSYQEAMSTLLAVALIMCVPVVVLALIMQDYKLDEVNSKAPVTTDVLSPVREGPADELQTR
ncbi:MFS general substrate transporter [Thozetella sp. PMI_491]|nr:MFS general substrate transporter [Thozetella sp. PMI_491]